VNRSRRLLFLGLAAAALLLGPAIRAGVMGEFTCSNKDCNFKAQLSFGGGFMFEQVTGYCCKCEKFVYLNWPRPAARGRTLPATRPAAPPAPLGKIWDPLSGESKTIYKCPTCGGPFLPVNFDQLKHCPKCGQEHVQFKRTIMFD
jgi:hypothetical protein